MVENRPVIVQNIGDLNVLYDEVNKWTGSTIASIY